MAGYIGTTPVPQATQHRESFTATGGQTSFATAGYTPQFIDVYLNGVKLAPADFTATNGSDVVLASGATASDILEIVAYTPFEVANQTFTGTTTATNLTVTGAFTSQGIDDNADAVAITIDSSENVGIGTSSPDKLVHLKTSVNNTAVLQIESTATDSYPFLSLKNDAREYQLAAHGPLGDVFTIYDGTAGSHRFVIDSSGSVGIGTSSPFNVNGKNLHVQASSSNARAILESSGGSGRNWTMQSATDGSLNFYDLTGSSEAMRIDSSGNLLVGTTDKNIRDSSSAEGMVYRNGDSLDINRSAAPPIIVNRVGNSDGDLVLWRKDGVTVGSIGTVNGMAYFASGDVGLRPNGATDTIYPTDGSGTARDNAVNFGDSGSRFKDLYLSGGVYLGGTGSANKLDDYEEGTFNATATSDGSATLSVSDEFYTKIGRIVHVSFTVTFSGSGNSGSLVVDDLPFSAVGTTPIGIGREDATDGYAVYGRMTSGSDDVDIWAADSISNSTAFKVASGNIRFSITYKCE